jgi:hypothetical protein
MTRDDRLLRAVKLSHFVGVRRAEVCQRFAIGLRQLRQARQALARRACPRATSSTNPHAGVRQAKLGGGEDE